MNSRIVRSFFFAALLGAPLVGFGQVMHTQAGVGTMHLTLLPGPTITSTSTGISPSFSQSNELIKKLEGEIRAQQAKLEAELQNLNRLTAELAEARKKALDPQPAPDLKFNYRATLPTTNTLPRPTSPPRGEIQFKPN